MRFAISHKIANSSLNIRISSHVYTACSVRWCVLSDAFVCVNSTACRTRRQADSRENRHESFHTRLEKIIPAIRVEPVEHSASNLKTKGAKGSLHAVTASSSQVSLSSLCQSVSTNNQL